MPKREQNSNKGTFGKVLNFCGSKNYIGAAYLATISSLKVGAGFSALATEKEVISSVSKLLPEVVYLSQKDGLKRIKEFNVILIGCGLGLSLKSKRLFDKVLNSVSHNIPMIIDADGLNILAEKKRELSSKTIITPHPKEAARLLSCTLEEVLNDLEGSAKKLCSKYNCTVVLKTHRTIICNSSLEIHINQHGNSALAKAGTGDVLAGVIAGLLAQGVNEFDASMLGVYLHSRAGEIAAEDLTEYSVVASDIPNYLHKAIKEISH